MTSLKQLIKIGFSRREAKTFIHHAQRVKKEIRRECDRLDNILNTELKLPEPF